MAMRLSSRLILAVVVIEAVMLSLLVWNSVRLISSSHAKLLEQSTREQTLLLANSLAPGLAFDDRATLEDVLSLLKDKQNLVYAIVYNRSGRILASVGSTAPEHRGGPVDHTYADARRDGVFDVERPIVVAGQPLGGLRAGYSIAGVEALTRRTRWQNTTIAGLELALTITATVLLGLVLTRHLRQLENGARALSRGDLRHRIDIRSGDEIGDLATAFNDLAAHLERTQAALQQEHDSLEREKRHLDTLLNSVNAVVWEADTAAGRFNYVSREAENQLGYPQREWLEPGFLARHLHPDDRDWVLEAMRSRSEQPGSFTLDFRMLDQGGRCLWIRNIAACETGTEGRVTLRGLMLDITDEKAADEHILFLAEHDALTGLYNRRRFQEELEQHVSYTRRYGHQGALLFIDLDQFKYINDSFGHQQGDDFLIQVANRLGAKLRNTDLLGRLGGDEFAVLLPRGDEREAAQVAQALLDALAVKDVEIRGGGYAHISASIGIVLFPDHGTSWGELLARADAAMYVAKDRGRNRYHLFREGDRNVARMYAKVHWEERIRTALQNDNFVLHYQPVVNLVTGAISHHEALLRMRGEDGNLVTPGAFLDVAERFGLIREIDHWVLDTAIRIQGESLRSGNPVRLALNLSGRHFGHTEVLELVRQSIERHQADPTSIIFEVTETAAVENLGEAQVFIEALRGLGCRFALDDFGIGFSSFYYLKNLQVDYVKIDGSFVRQLHAERSDAIFVKAMTDLAHGLGITAIAECIEHAGSVEILRDLGVDMGQGYYFGRPQAQIAATLSAPQTTI
jgi:diguanylate cyclase (GGDEF)-like protein/PAS domain S-box-containing protein